MSVQYATDAELASFLKQDVDTSTATLALQVTSQLFSTRAAVMFTSTTVTYQTQALGQTQLYLPFRPVTAVSAVRIVSAVAGTTTVITDYSRIKTVLYRLMGFGFPGVFPPDMVEVDLTHGFASVPDDVKGAVLESAAAAYVNPDISTKSESIDDYSVSSAANAGGVMLSPAAEKLADLYRGIFSA